MARGYVPRRGDLVRIALDPRAGHEQKGRLPEACAQGVLEKLGTLLSAEG